MKSQRSPLSIALSVWKALFLRESVSRLSTARGAWVWLLAEPIVHVTVLVIFFTVIRQRELAGVDITLFLITGVLSFFLVRNIAMRSMESITTNAPLFVYRQVKPVDAVLVRAALEALLIAAVSIVLFAGAKLLGFRIAPHNPLLVFFALLLLGFCGLGFGLVFSTINGLLPEFARAGRMLFQALYILSAVIYPIFIIPQPYRDLMMMNPLVHGIESVRAGFFSTYRSVPEVSLVYLAGFAVFSVFIGLLMQVRFQQRLLAR